MIYMLHKIREHIRKVRTQNHIRIILTKTCSVFNKNNVFYWIDYGTLLGVVRENDVIYGDNDGDICVVGLFNPEQMRKLKDDLKRVDVDIQKLPYMNAYRTYRTVDGKRVPKPFVDVYINTKGESEYVGPTGDTSNIPKQIVGNPKKMYWNGIHVKVPEHTKKALIWRYGEDYMTPKPGYKGRDQKVCDKWGYNCKYEYTELLK